MDEKSLRAFLSGLPLKQIHFYETIGSTNDEALAWGVQAGSVGEALFVAETQTTGRGRFDRRWVTRPGSALAFSLLLRPDQLHDKSLALYAPLAALAVSLGLESYGLHPQIKWPNDILLDRCKVAGILSEALWSGESLDCVVVGIGINVSAGSLPSMAEIFFPATWVEHELKTALRREELLAAVLQAFFAWRPRLFTPDFIQAWEARLAFRGEWVTIRETGAGDKEPLVGKLLGVGAGGELRLENVDGSTCHVLAGDLHLRPLQ